MARSGTSCGSSIGSTPANQATRADAAAGGVQEVNARVVKQAVKYVYRVDDVERELVDRLISSDRPPSLLERLRDRRRQKYGPT